jgi:hypothetical protein
LIIMASDKQSPAIIGIYYGLVSAHLLESTME